MPSEWPGRQDAIGAAALIASVPVLAVAAHHSGVAALAAGTFAASAYLYWAWNSLLDPTEQQEARRMTLAFLHGMAR
jgi:hypothetical protein